jgi:hypothetical protein
MSDEGYKLLKECKDSVKEQVREAIDDYIRENPDDDREDIEQNIDYSGTITEIYDGAVPVYYSEIMEIGNVPEVYNHENELGPAFDGTPTPMNILAGAIYEILYEVAWEEISDYLDELEEAGKFDEKDDEDDNEED